MISLLYETYQNSPNPRAFLNTVLAPCRGSGVREIADSVNRLSNSGYQGSGAGAGGAIGGSGN